MTDTASTVESAAPFRRRTLMALIAVGSVSLVVALVLAIFGDQLGSRRDTADANAYSPSAIGFEALIEVLHEVGVPATTSRSGSAARAQDGLLVIAAPDLPDERSKAKMRELIHAADRVLLVLPRWWGIPRDDRPEWIATREERPISEVEEVLGALSLDGSVVRKEASFTVAMEWGAAPQVPVAQLVAGSDLDFEVGADDDSALVLSTWIDDDTELFILSDPSVIDNIGLRTRANLLFAVSLIDDLRDYGPVVFDETLHGFEEAPSLQRMLTRFPLVLVSIQVLICALLLLWAAIGRWGPARAVAAAIPSGKDFLIRNTAALLHAGGHDGDALRRYLATTIQSVRTTLHAPRDLDPEALRTWLERLRAARGGTEPLPELEREVADAAAARGGRGDPRRIASLAARIHRWRTEMTHGPHDHP